MKIMIVMMAQIFLWNFAAVGAETQKTPTKPKYGTEATLLSASHEYIQKAKASDYWALSPYYVSQQDDRSCSVASMAMIANGARSGIKLTADDELVTQASVLKKVNDKTWLEGVQTGGHGVNLETLKTIASETLNAYGLKDVVVRAVHTPDLSEKVRAALHRDLVENEKSASNFIVANFIQGAYTGDADVGHIAPVGAYDAAKKRVLVLDPDRQWYEPYWVSEETFLKGMATKDKESSDYRGYLFISFKK